MRSIWRRNSKNSAYDAPRQGLIVTRDLARSVALLVAMAAWLTISTAAAQVGSISTGGLGGGGSFGSHGFAGGFSAHAGPVPRFGGCCGGVTVGFRHHPRPGSIIGGFRRQPFYPFGTTAILGPYWEPFYGSPYFSEPYEDESVVLQAPVEDGGLPRQPVSHFEEHVPAAPLIIELEGDHWVRRRVVEAQGSGQLAGDAKESPYTDEGAQTAPERQRSIRSIHSPQNHTPE